MRTLIVLAALCVPLFAAPIPKDAKPTPAELLQGSWKSVSIETEDGIQPFKGIVRTYDGERGSCASSTSKSDFTFKIEPGSNPLRVTFKSGESTSHLLYKIEGDLLYVCLGASADKFPTEFTAKGGQQISIYKREPK